MKLNKPTLCFHATYDKIGKRKLGEYLAEQEEENFPKQKNIYILSHEVYNNSAKFWGLVEASEGEKDRYLGTDEYKQCGIHELVELFLKYDGLSCREIIASFDKDAEEVVSNMFSSGLYGKKDATAGLKHKTLFKKFNYKQLLAEIGFPENLETQLNQYPVTDDCPLEKLVLQALLYPPRHGFTEYLIDGHYGEGEVYVAFFAPAKSKLEKVLSNRFVVKFEGNLQKPKLYFVTKDAFRRTWKKPSKAKALRGYAEQSSARKSKKGWKEVPESQWTTKLRKATLKLKEKTRLFKSLPRSLRQEIRELTLID